MEHPIVNEDRHAARRTSKTLAAAALCATVAGCASMTTMDGAPKATASIAPSTPALPLVQVPWQLTPASTASEAQGERTIVVDDPTYGHVKGTPLAVAGLRKPVSSFTAPTRTERACETVFAAQAKALGAYSVQVATAGPLERDAHGAHSQRVFFRIIYQKPDLIEVRQAAMRCQIDAAGKLVAATPV